MQSPLSKKLSELSDRMDSLLDSNGFLTHLKDIKTYLLPSRGRFLDGNDKQDVDDGNSKRGSDIKSSVPERAVHSAAAGIKGYFVTPSKPWCKVESDEHDPSYDTIKWWEHATEEMFNVMNKSNFYRSFENVAVECLGASNGNWLILDDEENIINCVPQTFGEYSWMRDGKGEVNVFMMKSCQSANEVISNFGDERVSDSIKKAAERNDIDERFWIYHLIMPNNFVEGIRSPDGKPIVSVYWERGKRILSVGGYRDMPSIDCPYNLISNDTFGAESPGDIALDDAKELYSKKDIENIGLALNVQPPMVANSSINFINQMPNGVTVANDAVGGDIGIKPLMQVNNDVPGLTANIQALENQIEATFFKFHFMLLSEDPTSRQTAYEAARKHEERLAMLSNVTEVFQRFLDRSISRIISIMIERSKAAWERGEDGLLRMPPEEVMDTGFKVRYTSLMANAQKATALRSIDSMLQFVASLSQFDPTAVGYLNTPELMEAYREGTGSPIKILKSPEQIQEQQEAEQKAMQQQATMEALQGASGAMKDIGSARKSEAEASLLGVGL